MVDCFKSRIDKIEHKLLNFSDKQFRGSSKSIASSFRGLHDSVLQYSHIIELDESENAYFFSTIFNNARHVYFKAASALATISFHGSKIKEQADKETIMVEKSISKLIKSVVEPILFDLTQGQINLDIIHTRELLNHVFEVIRYVYLYKRSKRSNGCQFKKSKKLYSRSIVNFQLMSERSSVSNIVCTQDDIRTKDNIRIEFGDFLSKKDAKQTENAIRKFGHDNDGRGSEEFDEKDYSEVSLDELEINNESIKIVVENYCNNLIHKDEDHEDSTSVLVISIFRLLQLSSGKNELSLQSDLFDILGTDNLDALQYLITNRDEIIYKTTEFIEFIRLMGYFGEASKAEKKGFTDTELEYGLGMVDLNPNSAEFDNLTGRNKSSKSHRYTKSPYIENLESIRDIKSSIMAGQSKYPHVYCSNIDDMTVGGNKDVILNKQFTLDQIQNGDIYEKEDVKRGKIVIEGKLFEEIKIPPPVNFPVMESEQYIPITAFSKFSQPAFGASIASLNRIQSIIYETAYKTNENILVCAPTGAGKTNVALMTILREIERNVDASGVLQLDKFKIVYVAPMKALAAEVADSFSKKLAYLGVRVREYTGDMQLTKTELKATQMLVTTPEKWDVVTRKSTGDNDLAMLVQLLIIDEVHLLHDERGSVLEVIVARTLRQIEATQTMVRLVGLSATLPNYLDVATFLCVNPYIGLFFFDKAFRPVPLTQHFIGVKKKDERQAMAEMNAICHERMVEHLKDSFQVLVFVHSRNETVKTAEALLKIAQMENSAGLLTEFGNYMKEYNTISKKISHSGNQAVKSLAPQGICVHHAGMLRTDRTLVEQLFSSGFIRVLVCTATLAWGVNLPAHAVIIKGTNIYDSTKGGFKDLNVLDIAQIFGRAGRPQFETHGVGYLITTHDKLYKYVGLMTQNTPIESNFSRELHTHLNAEICLGTVTNVTEATQWINYTYFNVRVNKNPTVYGLSAEKMIEESGAHIYILNLVKNAIAKLQKFKMIRFDGKSGVFHTTDLGRIASHFYLKPESIHLFSKKFKDTMQEDTLLELVSSFPEFENIQVRSDELLELESLYKKTAISINAVENMFKIAVNQPKPSTAKTSNDNSAKEDNTDKKKSQEAEERSMPKRIKVNILLQAYVSQVRVDSFSLISDMNYIAQNMGRILRGLFELTLRQYNTASERFLKLSMAVSRRMWWFNSHPLNQFPNVTRELSIKLMRLGMDVYAIKQASKSEIFEIVRSEANYKSLMAFVHQFPLLDMDYIIKPVSSTILQLEIALTAIFTWNDHVHGSMETFYVWIEDSNGYKILQHDYVIIHKRDYRKPQQLIFTIPISNPPPNQYVLRVISDRWIGSEMTLPVSFDKLILPLQSSQSSFESGYTDLLELDPLPKAALNNLDYEKVFNFDYFNALQTQYFHTVYNTDVNILLGAPTGSGKTLAAELALFRLFNSHPGQKAVYIAPLKALVKERLINWKARIATPLGKRIVELTGDFTPDIKAINSADIIVTTPEKWDGVTRLWQKRDYVRQIGLVIFDEIHMLGEERGPIIEIIVCRMNYIKRSLNKTLRIVGLSTALANATDMAKWMGIGNINSNSNNREQCMGLFNFRPSVRPVPLELHIDAFPGKHYCPRMATMNKPAYHSIKTYSEGKPVLIFVASRRQTRLTAFDLISLSNSINYNDSLLIEQQNIMMSIPIDGDEMSCKSNESDYILNQAIRESHDSFAGASLDRNTSFLRMPIEEMEFVVEKIEDEHLRHSLMFGIGMHHAGLSENDRNIVEELFTNLKIQVLVATSTLAWGVNLPARMVIVKGTEFFDGKTKKYVDFPVTDVLQMVGRAGRPQFDDKAVAMVFVEESKKEYYKKFLYNPFPVESKLKDCLYEHINAEIASGSITNMQAALNFMSWTYFYIRLKMNPSFYQLTDLSTIGISNYMSTLLEKILLSLESQNCILLPSSLATGTFTRAITREMTFSQVLALICNADEFDELPVRHNEDITNAKFAKTLPIRVEPSDFIIKRQTETPNTSTNPISNQPAATTLDFLSSNVKSHLLLQAYISRVHPLPVSDYITDTKSIIDQFMRVAQGFIDVASLFTYASPVISAISLLQSLHSREWPTIIPSVKTDSLKSSSLPPTSVYFGLGLSKQDQVNMEKCIPLILVHNKSLQFIKEAIKNKAAKIIAKYSNDIVDKISSHLINLPQVILKIKLNQVDSSKSSTMPSKLCKVTIDISAYGTTKAVDGFFLIVARATNELIAIKRISVTLNNKRNTSITMEYKRCELINAPKESIDFHALFPKNSYYNIVKVIAH